MTSRLKAEDLGLWRGDRCLCRGVSFTLDDGTLLQLVGANGSGKTSLLRAVAGIGRLDEGRLSWDDQPIRRPSAYQGDLAYVGHHNGLKQHLSATENYLFYQIVAEYSSSITASEALGLFGLAGVADRPVALLSMGQKRRAALARLLALKARLWLLDEPLGSLDAAGTALVMRLLRQHLEQGGMAMVSTHQPLELGSLPVQRLEMGTVS
ncbi:MAG TPA: cytochrome c biogenesis heme-transporting ATPase CcmA [Gammaproteobacteria bacterium]|nr:cytochrome c biogenesis heme-transporting ATPase CcmA [Gammaproteobacteria bacterium]